MYQLLYSGVRVLWHRYILLPQKIKEKTLIIQFIFPTTEKQWVVCEPIFDITSIINTYVDEILSLHVNACEHEHPADV